MRWGVLLVGFLGVLVVTNPGADSLQVGALFALGNAVMYGTVTVAVRGMAKTERLDPADLADGRDGGGAFAAAGLRLPLAHRGGCRPVRVARRLECRGAVSLDPGTRLGAGHRGVVAFYYLMLVWGMGLGYLAFGEVRRSRYAHLVVGGVIVVAAGALLLWHET